MIDKFGKSKEEATHLQAELENNLNTAKTILALGLEGNDQMERDLVPLKEELQVSLKWTSSSKQVSTITSQRNYKKRGLQPP